MDSSPLWSLPDDLKQIREDDPELIETILDSFVEQLRPSLAELETSLSAGNSAHASRLLHSLKGALLQIGAPSVADRCQSVRAALDTPGSMPAPDRLASLRRACEQVLREIARFRAEIPPGK